MENRNNFLENLIAQHFKEKPVRFSRIFHASISAALANIPIDNSGDGARGYLIHAITTYTNTVGPQSISINGENLINMAQGNPPNIQCTHNIWHFHDGVKMLIQKTDLKLIGTIHYQYITTASNDK